MKKNIVLLTLAALAIITCSCPVNPNVLPKVSGDVMHLLQETTNGQKFVIGDINSKDRLFVAKLKGTPYEMGKAFGTMFKEELAKQLKAFFDYYGGQVIDSPLSQIESAVETKIPKWMAQRLTKGTVGLLRSLLDLNIIITKKYTNPRYYEEIRGIADGTGTNPQDLKRINLIPELIKAACTVAGLWGPATAQRNTLHMRSLDWDNNNPINEFPVAIVYQPSTEGLYPHINLAWVGFIGSMTGVSQTISIGEKVWLPPKGSVPMTRYGNPWTYVFRDVLYETHNLQTALAFINNAHRTCAIHVGLASVEDHSFRMIEYAYKSFNVYDDKNYNHYTKAHPQKNGIAYWDKHVQPSGDSCVGELLTNSTLYGKWDAETFWRIVGLSHETGNTQLAVFDLENQKIFVSYSEMGTGLEAYKRRPIEVDMRQLMSGF